MTTRLTTNQSRAIALAREILAKGGPGLRGPSFGDAESHLLLLAAGQNNCGAPVANVAWRVLDNARQQVGYFAEALARASRVPESPTEGDGMEDRTGETAEASRARGSAPTPCWAPWTESSVEGLPPMPVPM